MLARRYFIYILAIAAFATRWVSNSAAQPMLINPAQTAGQSAAPSPPPPSVEEKRAENAEQLRVAMRKLEANGAADTATAQEVAYFQTRDAVLTQQDVVEQQVKDLESRKAELEGQLKSPPPDDKQYKFADLDRLKDDLAADETRATLLADKLTAAKTRLQSAKAALEECDVKRRQAQRDYETNKNAPNATELSIAADKAGQAAALASETLTLRKREVEREGLASEVLGFSIRTKQEQLKRISPMVTFTEADYQEQLASIKKNEDSLAAALMQAQQKQHHADIDLRNTQQQLEAGAGDKAVLAEVLTAHRRAREKYSEEIDSLTQRLQLYAQLRTAWSRRYEIAAADSNNTDDETWARFKTAQKETKAVLQELAVGLRAQITKMRETRGSLTNVTRKVDAAANGPPEIALQLGLQQKWLEETLRLFEKNMVTIETSRRVHEKLLDEVGQSVEVLTPKTIALGMWYQVTEIWKTRLFNTADDSITVGKATICLTVFFVGWIFSRFTSGIFANRLLKRFRLSKDATSAIRSLVFYCMLFLVGISALRSIDIDLTAFTILGGALAIGVGFGSQTLINNFIGGLIMLAERPVRLGERITFGDIDGVVEDVGFRCTKVRTQADHLVTIPNSTLVNESIENVDRRRTIRRTFTVAVTYNVTHEQLAAAVQAIRDILEEKGIRERIHPIVGFEELSPKVHFSDFATESLNIQVAYWYAPIDNNAFAEHSERVNFRIMEEFDRLGVQFAFPSKTAYVNRPPRPGRHGDSFAA
jgi:small-conductance mechanosensitive channel